MNLRSGYTALLASLPPLGIGIVGMMAGFLAAGLPSVKLARFGAGAEAVQGGVVWGGTVTALVVVVYGAGALWALRRWEAGSRARWKWAAGIAACGPVGWAVVLLGAALGAWAGGATEGG
ncbi:MAG: hypothetical protein JRI25_09130, partial [Deltaproteobacteria bacterium]|nr:hypothetical protein [Deltaproteobacteria bacterium]